MDWTKQGPAFVAPINLTTGQHGRVVIVGPRENPKGAVIVIAHASGGSVDTQPVDAHLDRLAPAAAAEIICMQERVFGASGLPRPQLS